MSTAIQIRSSRRTRLADEEFYLSLFIPVVLPANTRLSLGALPPQA